MQSKFDQPIVYVSIISFAIFFEPGFCPLEPSGVREAGDGFRINLLLITPEQTSSLRL